MTSNINPNNIDGAYPVAGQDNNSQGFRDNFTNTKTNFQYAADEISDLQTNAVLKAALNGTILDNDMLGSLVFNAEIMDMAASYVDLGTPSSSSITIDYSLGHYQTFTTNGARSVGFSNFPAAGSVGIINVKVVVANTADTVTFTCGSSGGWKNATGIRGCAVSTTNAAISFAATGTYYFQFITNDAGSTITINDFNQALAPFNNSKEALANSGAASLNVTAEYITATGTNTATLAAGVEGQIKTFVYYSESAGGNQMTVTVSNPGWGGSGYLVLTSVGQGCTLQFVNGKWFCIGNNGATFS